MPRVSSLLPFDPRPPRARRCRGRPAGFTLVEAAVVVAVLAVVALVAVPAMQATVDRARLDDAARTLGADLQLARVEAVLRQEPVRVSALDDRAGGRCVAVHTGPAADCTCDAAAQAPAACSGAARLLRHLHLPAHGRVRLAAPGASLLFDPQLGTCTPAGTFALSTPSGDAVHQIVNVLGRVRTCSPDGKVGGHVRC